MQGPPAGHICSGTRRSGFIFMPKPLSAEEEDLQSKRVQDLEQDRDQAGSR
jgi:hypothetical protein